MDELGFVPFDRAGGELLFNLLTARDEKCSIVVTTDLPFAKWVKLFGGDEKLTTPLLDRLAHHANVITTKGKTQRHRRAGSRREREDASHLAETRPPVVGSATPPRWISFRTASGSVSGRRHH